MPEWTCPSPDCGEILKGKNARSLSMKRANHERQHQAQDEYVPDILSRARAQGRGIDDLPEHPRPTVDPPETPEQAFPLDLIMGVVSQFSESQKTIQGTQGQIMETLSVMNQNQVALSDRLTKLEEFGNFIMNSAKGAGVPPPDPQPGDDGQALINLPRGQGGSIVESLIQAYVKSQGSSSGDGFDKYMEMQAKLATLQAATLNPGIQLVTNMLKIAQGIGLEPAQIIPALEQVTKPASQAPTEP